MNPVQHRSNNDVLAPPRGATSAECRPLPITRVQFSDGVQGVWSYWQPTDAERALIAVGAPVRISVIGLTHPPLHVGVDGDGL